MHKHKGHFIRNGPCPSCGSSDACAVYSDGTFCFACEKVTKSSNQTQEKRISKKKAPLLSELSFGALNKRKLTEETCKLWSYGTKLIDGEPVQVAQYRDPNTGEVVGQKIRTKDKDFRWRGDHDAVFLFGQNLWRDTGKMVVVTEGEIDAMSVSQIQQHKWPVVSIPDGASSADDAVRKSVDWLEKFEKVVLMFDNDEPGQKAAIEAAQILSPGKAYIARLPLKDANDMLVAGRSKEVIDAIWGAKPYRPDGVVCGQDLLDRVMKDVDWEEVDYPWTGLNTLTHGLRKGELVTLTAGTGVGKSEAARAIISYAHDIENCKIGVVALEESVERTARGLMGLYLGKRIHIDTTLATEEQKKGAFEKTVGSGRYFLYDHFGSLDSGHLLSRIRYMVVACGCDTVLLDHLSIVVSGSETDDERKAIDILMTQLRSLVQELKFRLIVINHLRRVSDHSHEEGGEVSLNHLRGSGSIAQLSDMVIALERDQQDETKKNLTRVRVLKNRHSGETGVACWLKYDMNTGRLSETEKPNEDDSTDSDEAGSVEGTTKSPTEQCPF